MSGLRTSAAAYTYISLVSAFLITAGAILTTLAVYLTAICALYMVLAKQKWWKLLRLDAPAGGGLLLILDIAWLAKNITDIEKGDDNTQALRWLIVIVDISLCLLSAGVVGVAIYVSHKLKTRTHLAVGNVSEIPRCAHVKPFSRWPLTDGLQLPSLLISASFLWLFRCTFVLSVHLKSAVGDWTADDLSAQVIVYPILDFWVSATVLSLVTVILRRAVWSDPAAMPDGSSQHPSQMFVPQGYYPHTQYNYQQGPQMYPVSYSQQPVMYQQYPPELSPTLVPAVRTHEANGTQRPLEHQGPNAPLR